MRPKTRLSQAISPEVCERQWRGPDAAAPAYDAFGRRVAKTVNGATTGYLYDGVNPVEEFSGAMASASLLTGLGVDEYLQRTDGSGAADYLTDAMTGRGGTLLARCTSGEGIG